jgi:hypothetical protein
MMLRTFTCICCFLGFFFGGAEVECRAPHLLGRCSTTWGTPPTLFLLICFWDRILPYAQAGLDQIAEDDRYVPWCPAVGWDEVFFSGPLTIIPPISAFQEARIAFYFLIISGFILFFSRYKSVTRSMIHKYFSPFSGFFFESIFLIMMESCLSFLGGDDMGF